MTVKMSIPEMIIIYQHDQDSRKAVVSACYSVHARRYNIYNNDEHQGWDTYT